MRAESDLFGLPPMPDTDASALHAVGGFLRERIGWVTGVVMTVVGAFYMAGTAWGDLAALWRSLIVVGFLALYALGFAVLGGRLTRIAGGAAAGRWLIGVSVALAPIHGMAAGSLWSTNVVAAGIALGGVALLHGLLQARTFRSLLGKDCRGFRAVYLLLSVGVGVIPLAGGPQWLLLPAVAVLLALWAILCRLRALPSAATGLLVMTAGLYLYRCPAGPLPSYAPLAALAALGALYVDAALGRWRGIHRVRLVGLRGVLALVFAALAWLLVLPSFQFLPKGYESSLAGLFLTAFFALAALAWRRPPLWWGGLAAALLFTLSLPDLARAVVTPLLAMAGTALGYESEPLPLAWYSLTLLPYLLVCQLVEHRLRASSWRQRDVLARITHAWSLGLSALLLVVAHTRPDDLRPALIALPIYTLLWLRQSRVRALAGGTLPWIAAAAWATDLMLHMDMGSGSRAVLAAILCGAIALAGRLLADRLNEAPLARGAEIVSLVAAPVLPPALVGSTSPMLGLGAAGAALWLVSLSIGTGERGRGWVRTAIAGAGLLMLTVATGIHLFGLVGDRGELWATALFAIIWSPVVLERIARRPRGRTAERLIALLVTAGTLVWAAELLRLTLLDRMEWSFAAAGLHVVLLAVIGRRSLALWLGWLGLSMLTLLWAGLPSGGPAAVTLGASGLARGLGMPRSAKALFVGSIPFCLWPAVDGLTTIGLATAGALFAMRYVMRARTLDLLAGLALLDGAAVALALRSGWTEPLAFAGPLGLSVLVAAQLLRRALDPRVTVTLRYTAAATLYLSAFADAVLDPLWSAALLLMCLIGMGAGALLRVRAFLYLGAGFAGAAMLTELLRFGLTHSHFWALYLTVLGLLVLGAMVVLTLARQPLLLLRDRFARTVETWE